MSNSTRPCSACEKPMRVTKGSKQDGTQMCHPCRRIKRDRTRACIDCGADYPWVDQPRCSACRYTRMQHQAVAKGRTCTECDRPAITSGMCGTHYSYRYRETHGRVRKPGAEPEWYIHPATRLAIYERDAWTCQLCGDPVDKGLMGQGGKHAPSLDHIIPRSTQLLPDHTPTNLRLAHVGCNARRGNAVGELQTQG